MGADGDPGHLDAVPFGEGEGAGREFPFGQAAEMGEDGGVVVGELLREGEVLVDEAEVRLRQRVCCFRSQSSLRSRKRRASAWEPRRGMTRRAVPSGRSRRR